MKLKTNYTVTVLNEEAGRLLTKFVEKKTSKKVTKVENLGEGFSFTLQDEDTDLDVEVQK